MNNKIKLTIEAEKILENFPTQGIDEAKKVVQQFLQKADKHYSYEIASLSDQFKKLDYELYNSEYFDSEDELDDFIDEILNDSEYEPDSTDPLGKLMDSNYNHSYLENHDKVYKEWSAINEHPDFLEIRFLSLLKSHLSSNLEKKERVIKMREDLQNNPGYLELVLRRDLYYLLRENIDVFREAKINLAKTKIYDCHLLVNLEAPGMKFTGHHHGSPAIFATEIKPSDELNHYYYNKYDHFYRYIHYTNHDFFRNLDQVIRYLTTFYNWKNDEEKSKSFTKIFNTLNSISKTIVVDMIIQIDALRKNREVKLDSVQKYTNAVIVERCNILDYAVEKLTKAFEKFNEIIATEFYYQAKELTNKYKDECRKNLEDCFDLIVKGYAMGKLDTIKALLLIEPINFQEYLKHI